MIDQLWGERPPATASKTLQRYISHLRKALGNDVLLTRGGGYLLAVAPGPRRALPQAPPTLSGISAPGPAVAVVSEVTLPPSHDSRTGAEVSQVCVGLPPSAGEPPKRLVGDAKTSLTADQTTTVHITIDPSASTRPLSYVNTTADRWEIAPGTYTVYVGSSERTTPLTATFTVG